MDVRTDKQCHNSVISVIWVKSLAPLNKRVTRHPEKGVGNLGVVPTPQSQTCCQYSQTSIGAF
ncbi:tsl1728 [Thermosynechococcus vestitus BP-1]|uniref:Tsl1728 protein n=1 Tax=Thermosynechococcus vestitus (strain NIES-2133 / IAM M-273 / BP-1) TaxID=197221 RepID=Q8DI63_THEVB|nr:tsl1728 [Thermosynechococcus vestitus BP-1]